MSKGNRSKVALYPEEKEGRIKDANNKLKSQVKRLKKALKIAESDNKTLSRAFDKSCDLLHSKLDGYSLEQIMQMIEDFEYKETKKGREIKIKDKVENFKLKSCPKCDKNEMEGYSIMSFKNFRIDSCSCGYRLKVETDEGIDRS